MGAKGYSYKEILLHYFRGAESIEKAWLISIAGDNGIYLNIVKSARLNFNMI